MPVTSISRTAGTDACPHDVLEFVGSQVEPVNVEDCTGCGSCEFACPIGAIVGIMNR